MLKVQSTRVVQLLLVCLLTIMLLAGSIVGATTQPQVAANDSTNAVALFQTDMSDMGPTADNTCNGGSDGSCGG